MSRKSKRAKAKRKQQKPRAKREQQKRSQPNNEVAELTTRLTLRAGLLTRIGITLIAPTILASYSLYLYFRPSNYNAYQPTWADAQVLAMVIFLIVVLLFVMSLDITAKMFKVSETPQQRNLRRATVLKTFTVTVTALFYLTLLQQGYLNGLADYLKSNVFPLLSEGVNYILSNIVVWAISGAVGNFFYDLMKKVFERGKNKKKR